MRRVSTHPRRHCSLISPRGVAPILLARCVGVGVSTNPEVAGPSPAASTEEARARALAQSQAAIRDADVDVRRATAAGELRAAAAARTLSFYTYPADRSEFSVRGKPLNPTSCTLNPKP